MFKGLLKVNYKNTIPERVENKDYTIYYKNKDGIILKQRKSRKIKKIFFFQSSIYHFLKVTSYTMFLFLKFYNENISGLKSNKKLQTLVLIQFQSSHKKVEKMCTIYRK